MVKQVAARSGYQLQLDGHCVGTSGRSLVSSPGECLSPPGRKPATGSRRQHASGRGALPLLSHQLSVKQVMLKGAVIN